MVNYLNESWSSLTTSKLSTGSKYIMLCMIKSAYPTNILRMSLNDMSEEFGVTKKTVIDSIKTLTQLGYLRVEKSNSSKYGNLSNRYFIYMRGDA